MPHMNIEKGVDLKDFPKTVHVSKHQDLIDILARLEVGDSFTVPAKRQTDYETVVAYLKRKKKLVGFKFASRREDNVTLRIWRTE